MPTRKTPARKRKRAHSSEGGDDDDYVPPVEPAVTDADTVSSSHCSDVEEVVTEDVEQNASQNEPTETTSPETKKKSVYLPYNKAEWSPLYLYRPFADLTAACIRQSGSEGVGRVEVGRSYGIDTTLKAGNRRVSQWIMNTLKAFPDYFGQYQKMDGKCRSIKYFWKVDAQPERFISLYKEWQKITDVPCPFKMGQVIKFPKANLNTLRISDVSLRRLIDMLRLVKENVVYVTVHRFLKHVTELEQQHGYNYKIDKKSVMKCLYALQKAGLVRLYERIVVEDYISSPILLICNTDVESANDPVVDEAIRAAIDGFHEEGRVFPHGQLRYDRTKMTKINRKKLEEHDTSKTQGFLQDIPTEELQKYDNDDFAVMTVEKRLSLVRLQSVRRTLIQPSDDKSTTLENEEIPGEDGSQVGEDIDDKSDPEDTTVVEECTGETEKSSGTAGAGGGANSEKNPSKQLEKEKIAEKITKKRSEKVVEKKLKEKEQGTSKEANTAGKATELKEEGQEQLDDIKTSETKKTSKASLRFGGYDPSVNYGCQNKMIKCYILHQMVYQFVFGHPDGTKPTIYEKYPPSKPMALWQDGVPVEECTVYVDDESPFRFMPPCPKFEELPRGWFMLQDLVNALPLSIFALLVRMKSRCEPIEPLLRDPIMRHLLVMDLPHEVRVHLLVDKRALRYVEHLLLTMCGMGLFRVAPNVDPKRYPLIGEQFFFMMRGGVLRDTSTSDRGYACVTPPIERYQLYDYSFESLEDIRLYWHHLRAIVQSTPLAFRHGAHSEEVNPVRLKKYAFGVVSKTELTKTFDDLSERADAVPPLDGCAGFDSVVFVHLRRHWDIQPRPSDMVNWFLADWRRGAEKAKPLVECRVERLQKTWNSYIKSLMPSDGELWKKNKVDESMMRHCHSSLSIESKKIRTRNVRIERRLLTTPAGKKVGGEPTVAKRSKKRPMDSVDMISEQRRIHMRSRFSAKERDMLVLIRAVGFFLNPVYRFWLDPTVLRDVMHEYVPESRTKTVQSLMAAGVREMVRPNKIAYLQRIVRNLSSFKEMRILRSQLATQPLSNSLAKRQFFIKAFNMATRLLFMESSNMPRTDVTDEQFEKFLSEGNVSVTAETPNKLTFPMRSTKPNDLNHIRHCIAFNIVMSMLLCDEDLTDVRLERLIEQLSACSLSNVLEQLRVDGLIAKQRPQTGADIITNRSTKNQATLSYYYRHFFNHRFHVDIVDQTNEAFSEVERCETITVDDRPGMVVAAMRCFYSDLSLDLTMPDDLLQVFDTGSEQLANVTKHLRYLESADLHLERIKVTPVKGTQLPPPLPSSEEIFASLRKIIPKDKLSAIPFDDFLLAYSTEQRALLRSVYQVAADSSIFGASLEEIKEKLANSTTNEDIEWALQEMQREVQLVLVGVDCDRYVTAANGQCWILNGEQGSFFAEPWTTLNGDINPSTVRWMMEGILFAIVNRPGVNVSDLKSSFSFALQPRMLVKLLEIFEKCGCIEVCREMVTPLKLRSPFDTDAPKERLEYVIPKADCIERFSRIFHSITLSDVLTSNRIEYV